MWGLAAFVMATLGLSGLSLVAMPSTGHAQTTKTAAEATLDSTMEAGEADAEEPRRKLVKWNELDGPVSTLRVGWGFLVDFATYAQDQESKQQFTMEPDLGLRDFRVILKGRFKTRRPFSWTVGYMYDGKDDSWRFRQTGFLVGVPELSGQLFIGRGKEGYSMVKIMSGYNIWTMERSTSSDAFVPILADGVRCVGYAPKHRMIWNLGWFTDVLSSEESFSTYSHQVVARVGWLPILSEADGTLLHVALMGRDARPENDQLKQRSRPEMYLAPYFIDTGQFPSSHVRTTGFEAYYRVGPWMAGAEYSFQNVSSSVSGDPLLHGGEAMVAWLITGETRPYNTAGGYFKSVSPARTVFEGGPGAWEAVLRFSTIDLDAGTLRGGKYWRLTPMVNWYLADFLRLEVAYGYGTLDRFELQGTTQFFQARMHTYY